VLEKIVIVNIPESARKAAKIAAAEAEISMYEWLKQAIQEKAKKQQEQKNGTWR
jgi:predicted HicB family RNase H-like nuclease